MDSHQYDAEDLTADALRRREGLVHGVGVAPAAGSGGEHERWMAEAIALARSMQGHVWPNPSVGCVIVGDGKAVGRGQTQVGGRPHAERVALDDAGDLAHGASLYVTLEPCCHWGKTPPCADAITAAGVTVVHASLQDPDPRVNGGGFRKLREAGIRVEVGLAAREARDIMAGFFHRVATGRPLMTLGERLQRTARIPDGFDALLEGDEDGIRLSTRMAGDDSIPKRFDRDSDRDALLDTLGRLGLTSVYVPSGDRLAGLFPDAIHKLQEKSS